MVRRDHFLLDISVGLILIMGPQAYSGCKRVDYGKSRASVFLSGLQSVQKGYKLTNKPDLILALIFFFSYCLHFRITYKEEDFNFFLGKLLAGFNWFLKIDSSS